MEMIAGLAAAIVAVSPPKISLRITLLIKPHESQSVAILIYSRVYVGIRESGVGSGDVLES